MRAILLLIALSTSCFSLTFASAQEPKVDPQAKLETTIAEMIRLLEAKEYKKMIETFAHPDQLKDVIKEKQLDQIAEDFGANRAALLAKILKSLADVKPTWNKEMTTATFPIKEKDAFKESIEFAKVEGRWYLKN